MNNRSVKQKYKTKLLNEIFNQIDIENSLVFMIDDLHLADKRSMSLINEIIDETSNHPLLIIGTFDNEEIARCNGIKKIQDNLNNRSIVYKVINFEAFDLKQMDIFISCILIEPGEKSLSVKNLKITPEIADKIKKIKLYINNNYSRDISREGLAAMIGIHPDYLGKLFKLSTGMTLNEYINDLRIKEAAKKLKKEDENIIDIAFSVGFETLSTFNRAFQKIMRTTPSEYKTKNLLQ